MKVLVTGACGFIGSHLAELCVREGFDVRAFVHYNSNNSWGWLSYSELTQEMEIVSGDIRDYDSVFKAMNGCSTVFHLAALIGIPYSYISPQAYIRTNIEGTYNVLEAGKHLNLEHVLVTSTSETYGSAQYVPIDEQHPLVGQSPYSATKIAADQLALSYYTSFDLPVKIVRPFNTYGTRQSARAIIPTVITQLASGSGQLKVGSLHPTRDLTFVEDTTEGFLAIYRADALTGEVTNIGSNSEISIGDLIMLIGRLMNKEIELNTDKERVRPAKSEVVRLLCDNSRILQKTDWRPKVALERGLLRTIDWLMAHSSLYKPELYNV